MPKSLNLSGKVFGRLTVLTPSRTQAGRTAWMCQCSCGNTSGVQTSKLTLGTTKSCGCLWDQWSEDFAEMARKHGHYAGKQSPTYSSWANIMARCRSKTNPIYGGRGVIVCSRLESYENYLTDMGERPPGASKDRIDNERGYEPDNSKWSNRVEQANNRRNVRVYSLNGITKSLPDWCREKGVHLSGMYARVVVNGMSLEAALAKPWRTNSKCHRGL